MGNSSSSSSGIGFGGVLAILFIGLKLSGIITWSWWWVLSPLWFGLFLILLAVIIACIYFGIKYILE